MKNNLFYLCLLLFIFGCFGPDLDEFSFFEVSTGEPELIQLGSAKLNGLISGVSANGITDHGFHLATSQSDLINNSGSVQQISLNSLSGNSAFEIETTLTNLDLNEVYHYRAYARSGGREVFAKNIESFSFQVILEVVDTIIDNDSVQIQGRITGLEFLGLSVEEHGHVISKDNPEPEIEQDLKDTLGPLNDDGFFYSSFGNLEFNTTYYVRAYAKSDRVYYSNTQTFTVKDGWQKAAGPGVKITQATAAALGSTGYVIFGCQELAECNAGTIYKELREFDPAANGGLGNWVEKEPFPALFSSFAGFNASSFTIDETFYVGLGNTPNGFVADWFRINLQQNDNWELIFASPSPERRAGAVSFVIKGKAYVGTGMGNNSTYLNDFWEFDPSDESWRPVASLPFKENEQKGILNQGRSNAVSMAINGKGYAGSGVNGLLVLRDFWEFTPPVNTQDTGKWILHSFFPDQGRFDAVAFTIGDKRGYFGTGENFFDGILSDFWEFDPAKTGSEAWKQVTSFQGEGRARAVSFGFDDKGYVGFGDHRVFDGSFVAPETLSDFWKYIPKN